MERGEKNGEEIIFCVGSMLTSEEKKELHSMIDQLVKIKKPENMLLQFCEGSEEKMRKDIDKFCYVLERLVDIIDGEKLFPIQSIRIILFSWGHRFQCAVQHLVTEYSKETIAKMLRVDDAISVVDMLYMDAPSTELDAICEEIDKTIQTNEAIWMKSCLPKLQETVNTLQLDIAIDVATDGNRDDYFLHWYRQLLSVYSENQRSLNQEAKRIESPEFYKAREAVRASIKEVDKPDDVHKSFKDFFCLASSEAKITKPVKQLAKKRLQQIVAKDYFRKDWASDDALKRELEDVLAVYLLAGQIHVGLSFLPSMRNQNPCSLHMILYANNAPQKFLLDRINGQRQQGLWRGVKLRKIVWIAPNFEASTLSPPLTYSHVTDTCSSSLSQDRQSSYSSSQETHGCPSVQEARSLSPSPILRMLATFSERPKNVCDRWRYLATGLSRRLACNDMDREKWSPRMEGSVPTSDQGTSPLRKNRNVVVDLAKLSVMNREATQAFLRRANAFGRTDIAEKVRCLSTEYQGAVLDIIAASEESSFHGTNRMAEATDLQESQEISKHCFFTKMPDVFVLDVTT